MTDSVIENYRIIEEIAQGGMGRVFKAVHTSLERIVAIKMIHPKLLSNKNIVKNFYNEAKIQASLNHPNIVAVYDFFEHNENHYVVMEFIDGESISKIIHHQGEFEINIAISIFKKILQGIKYAHSKNVIHKDIKTGNFLLTPKTVKITDFGIAQIIDETNKTEKPDIVIGTPKYMSPEQLMGKQVDKRTDIYSLGIILYEFLTGTVPFPTEGEKSPFEIRKSQLNATPKKPSELNNKIPKAMDSIVLKALQNDPLKRYQNIDEFIEAVNSFDKSVVTETKSKSSKTGGSLSKNNIADIISSLYFKSYSGSLIINSAKRIIVHFHKGLITFIDYNEPSLHLGKMLISNNLISREDLDETLEYTNKTGDKFGVALIKLKKLSHHDLNDILEIQIKQKLHAAFSIEKGSYVFKESMDFNSQAIYQINPLQVVYDSVKNHNYKEDIYKEYKSQENQVIIPRNNILDEVNKLVLTSPKEIKLITILKYKMSLDEFFLQSSINDKNTGKFLSFLILANLIQIKKSKNYKTELTMGNLNTEIIKNG